VIAIINNQGDNKALTGGDVVKSPKEGTETVKSRNITSPFNVVENSSKQ
jgi:hypothetical protein